MGKHYKTKLQAAFPNNTFNFPPYANIDFYGVKIEAFNNTQSDYDYYIANNVTDYNQYSQMVRCSYKSSSIIVMGDAGQPAQDYQYSLGKFKPTNIYCLPHHGLEGVANIGMLRKMCPQYMFVSNGYNSNAFMRDYALVYAGQNDVTVFDALSAYPADAVGSFSDGTFLCGAQKSYSSYGGQGHTTIHFDASFPATNYQDGTEGHPFSSMRRAIGACKGGYNEIVFHSNLTDAEGAIQITADNGYVYFSGAGNTCSTSIILAHGARAQFNSLFNAPVVSITDCSEARFVACGTIGTMYLQESMLTGSSFTVSAGSYRNSVLLVGNTDHSGSGNFPLS